MSIWFGPNYTHTREVDYLCYIRWL